MKRSKWWEGEEKRAKKNRCPSPSRSPHPFRGEWILSPSSSSHAVRMDLENYEIAYFIPAIAHSQIARHWKRR